MLYLAFSRLASNAINKSVEMTPRNYFFLFSKAATSLIAFVGSYFVQAFLISFYPSSVNASVQVALKIIALQGLFTSGFSILILSHPANHKKFLYRAKHAYWLSIITRLTLLVSLSVAVYSCQELTERLGIAFLIIPLLLLLALGLFAGEGQAYAYATQKSFSYETSILILQIFFFLTLSYLLISKPPSSYASIYALVCLLLPRYIINLIFSVKAYPPFLLLKLPTSATLAVYRKAISSSLLMAVAFLNWSVDVLIVAALGFASSVNMLSVFTLIFSFPQMLLGFLAPKLQLRWSDNRKVKNIKQDFSFLFA